MPSLDPFKETRDQLADFVRRRLLGPGGSADLLGRQRLFDLRNASANQPEILLGAPTGIYHTGILFPPVRLALAPLDRDEAPDEDETDDVLDSAEDTESTVSLDKYEDTEAPVGVEPNGANDEPLAGPDDDLVPAADPLRNFSQLYPRYMGLSCCVPAADPNATLYLSYRRYEAVSASDKKHIALLLTDYPQNPHYSRLLVDAEYGPLLSRYFEVRLNHAAGPLLSVREVPDTRDKEAYAELSRALQRIRRETDALFSKKRRSAEGINDTPDIPDSDETEDALAASTSDSDALLRQWDRLRFSEDPAVRGSTRFQRLTQQIENLQQLYFTYQAFQKLAFPLRSTDAYNTYWQAKDERIELPLALGEWQQRLRHGRHESCFTFEADNGGQLAQPCDPVPHSADGHRLRVRILLRRDDRHRAEALFVKVQAENFSQPVVVDEGGPYPSYDTSTASHCLFGVNLALNVPGGLLPYQKAGASTDTGSLLAEDATIKFLYRHAPPYAIGHGVAASWPLPDDYKRVTRAETNYLPYKDVPDISPAAPHSLSDEPEARLLTEDDVLRFQWLGDFGVTGQAEDSDILDGLRRFIAYYQHWINKQTSKALKAESPEKHALVREQMQCCQRDLDRMRRNIELLATDTPALQAFRLANAAMFVQLWHGSKVGKNTWRPGDPTNTVLKETRGQGYSANFYAQANDKLRGNQPAAWRPFQLAFILLNIDGFVRPEPTSSQALFELSTPPTEWHERNALVDLVWFPTGGGKTEAYLGLIAFCALHRRLAYPTTGGGTAVLMRYTLRLLTLQQFQRATRLVLALEIVRSWPRLLDTLGKEPFSIGLWVGSKFLPNKLSIPNVGNAQTPGTGLLDISNTISTKIAEWGNDYKLATTDDMRRELETRARAECGKIPVVACPCCGTDLFDLKAGVYGGPVGGLQSNNQSTFNCLGLGCLFGPDEDGIDGPALPILLCDELLYHRPPTLLFGTVDKFAALAHKTDDAATNDTRRLFGNRRSGTSQRPPNLIIQDELHLLQGPLGSSVALFESVLDQLCRVPDGKGKWTRAKIISSTATTRNTVLQVWALYDRHVNVFPKPGVRADNSFYAVYRRDLDKKELSKRRYLGVCPTGKTLMITQRHLLGLLLAHRLLTENSAAVYAPSTDGERDKDTNALIDAYYSVVAYFGSLREVGKTASQVDTFLQSDYLRLLDDLLLTQPLHYSYRYLRTIELTGRMNDNQVKAALVRAETPYDLGARSQNVRTTPDLLLATSMISVGIDIGRLNIMLVNGMPKSMAEYIQASSRVAREHAGLVITLHHPLRPRDLSHFEHFTDFHDRLYAFVEPLSITPFTNKALARYLPTVLAAMIRQQQPSFGPNTSAGDLTDAQTAIIKAVVYDYFQSRHENLIKLDAAVVGDNVRHLLGEEELVVLKSQVDRLFTQWESRRDALVPTLNEKLAFGASTAGNQRLYADLNQAQPAADQWRVNWSLREIEPQTALKIEQE
ncbi:helicase domain protein [Hymenobacter roseosalivarius DSM 11622]|uniref:Helicase domain protein n=1 Tax=Hymenobacter roseosalivarius DSM 11622 TaxID=645990 RepID=A0A1W1VFN1_9BACT|nr:helicase-related protein [Hymenobacter roseosalivarius]SMB92188.1 helicase domain protein [Hymenobacter roseosalivarius DSM 11622]